MLFREKCAAIYTQAEFMKFSNVYFKQTSIQDYCGISVINCASKCDTDVGCLAFNYNRGTRACRLLGVELLNQIAWPGFENNEEWTIYVKPLGKASYS